MLSDGDATEPCGANPNLRKRMPKRMDAGYIASRSSSFHFVRFRVQFLNLATFGVDHDPPAAILSRHTVT